MGDPSAVQSPTADGRRAQAGQAMTDDAVPTPQPAIRIEYQLDRSVLKVHDSRGTLIYQIPSAGTLLLIEQTESAGTMLNVRA